MKTSAGLLPYRWDESGELLVFVAHMGGPLWAQRYAGGWSIVKGEYDAAGEDPRDAARREFLEETGAPAPDGDWTDLGEVRTTSGKVITAWAVEAPATLALVEPGLFEMEWPPKSGRRQSFPEIDRAEWKTLAEARVALVAGQVPFLDRLAAAVRPAPEQDPATVPPEGPDVPGHRPYGDDVVGVVGVAVVDDLDAPRRLLAGRRSGPGTLAGGWELPGGKVEPGEPWRDAAVRELAEELGVTIRLGGFVPGPLRGGLWPLGTGHAMAVWLGVTAGDPRPLADHDELRWLTRATLYDVDWLPGDLPVVRALETLLLP